MEKLQSAIIERIRLLMYRRGFSGNELERQAGLSSGYVSQLLQGKRLPSLYTLDRIEGALGAPVLTIAGRQPNLTRSGRSYAQVRGNEPMPSRGL